MIKSIEDIIEPNTDDNKKFNLSLKQLQFIQNDNNLKFVNEIMKTMKRYKYEIEDINNILDKHNQNELKKQEKNEARRIKKQQEKYNSNSEDEIISNKSSNKSNRNKKEAIQEKDKLFV